MMYILSGYF